MAHTGNHIPDIRTLPGYHPGMSLAQRQQLMEAYATPAAEDEALFQKILDMETQLKISHNLQGMSSASPASVRREQVRLFDLIDSLTPGQVTAFGAYRRTVNH
jgi:hypothetical protein